MDKNIIIDVMEEQRAKAFATVNTMNKVLLKKIGVPLLLLLLSLMFPPGTVKAAANATVAMRIATTVHD
ncbi:hypothetical protein BVC80_7201g2 [Macleaya cordata]|uniref:Uncharacterized protein n=1 Tax=Macleaya cordata TaxID=56857 RepID=A0A200PY97_MACCD|nr:hypothetical protein BVC80_7201g2 [Macleaya cordata]